MIGIKIDKSMFFDRPKVQRAIDRGVRKVLSRFGAFVRTTARHSMRKRKAVSQPGSPPSAHVGLLKKLLFFGYDAGRKSVVIGPTPLRGEAEAPPLLEYGGKTRLRRHNKNVVAVYRARPFMGPAFEQEKKKLPALWANSIK
jgi:hypothetical protein